MADAPTYWMLVSSPENFERSRARGFDLAGMKSRHGKKAERVKAGDKVIFYLTGVQAFGGTAEATGPAYEDHEPIWDSKKEGEDYPFRFPIRLLYACPKDDYVAVAPLVPMIRYLRKWPAEHWRLGFQGNVHSLPKEDWDLISLEVERRAKGKKIPPGVPPTEAERPPKIPAKLRKRPE
jgi:hypothetical protein